MAGLCAALGVFASCDEKDPINGGETPGEGTGEVKTELSVAQANPTSATFTVTGVSADSVAYYVHEGVAAEDELDPIVMFAEAQEEGRIAAVVNDSCAFSIYSLEGGKEYTVYVVYTEGDELVSLSAKFETTSYDRLINVIESRKDGFTFHFNVPEGKTYMYALLPTEQYNSFRASRWADDVTFLSDGIKLTGSQTIVYNSGEDWFEEGDGGHYIHPGSAYTVMIAECDEFGDLLYYSAYPEEEEEEGWNGEVWGPMSLDTRAGATTAPRMGGYTEEPWKTDERYPTGFYARQNLLAALEIVESKVKMELTGKTERRIKIRCTADDDVQYVVAPFDKYMYNELVGLVGEDAIAATLLEYYGWDIKNGTQDIELDENTLYLELDSTYIISVVGVYAEDASIISHDTIHVTMTRSTLPPAELTITACGNPDGEPTPNLVWFHLKSEAKNVVSAKHIANYTKDVVKEKSYGFTDADLITYYGEELSEQDILDINSDEGLYLSLWSLEDAENTLIVAAYNEEEGATYYTCESRSAALPTLAPVESSLFEELKGEWTARVIRMKSVYDEEIWDYVTSRDTVYSTISLGESFDNSPETFDENHEAYSLIYDSYLWAAMEDGASEEEAAKIAKDRVVEQFEDYKKTVTKYEEKYKGQNYILGLGFEEAHPYKSPWDLFCSDSYSAYDSEELFYAFGPKLFFQVQEDGTLRLKGDVNILSLPPVAAWEWYEYVLAGNNPDDASTYYTGDFPVEVSEDKNTLVIQGVEVDGQMYYPAIGYLEYGVNYIGSGFQTIADIQLTRGAVVEDEEVTEEVTRAAKAAPGKEVKSQNNRIKRTYLPSSVVKVKTSKMTYIPVVEKIKEKYNK